MKYTLVVILLLASAAAQSIPNAPSETRRQIFLAPLRSPTFYLGTGTFAASAIADVHSTKVCEYNRTCVEAYKGHDRYGYVVPLILLVGAAEYGCEIMLHDHHYRWYRRTICPALGIAMSIQHWQDARNIYPNGRVATR